jgi:hypothetical protein
MKAARGMPVHTGAIDAPPKSMFFFIIPTSFW